MSYLKQAQDAYKRHHAGREAAAADSATTATGCEKSECAKEGHVAPAPLPPMDDAEEHAGGVNGVTGAACWACHKAVYWIRRKEVGGGVVCATCHPPHHAVQQGTAP